MSLKHILYLCYLTIRFVMPQNINSIPESNNSLNGVDCKMSVTVGNTFLSRQLKIEFTETKIQTKICTRCLIEKELSEFYKEPRGKYGVVAMCKGCYHYKKKGLSPLNIGVIKPTKICSRCHVDKVLSDKVDDIHY